ncbi:MAG: tyrosine-protein phosphatase [Maricaulaceae bacterium]
MKLIKVGIISAVLALSACQQGDGVSRSAMLMEEAGVADGRLLSIDGTRNTRDLGGYAAADGRTVKWGMIYRSDNLGHLTKIGKADIAALKVVAITDLRSGPEREQEPDKIPETTPAITYSVLPINDQPVDIKKLSRKIAKGDVDEAEIMELLDHRRFITNPAHRKNWGDWVKNLAEDEATPHLFHCTSGKDRAGFGAAITLLTLGVPKETVMEDFLLSNMVYADYIDENTKKIKRFVKDEKAIATIRKVMGVSEETMVATFAEMEAQYGSVDGFIKDGLGIDDETRARLQDKFLE